MTWRPVEEQLRAHLPAALDRLNPPAGADDLRRFEAEVEAPLPEGFRNNRPTIGLTRPHPPTPSP